VCQRGACRCSRRSREEVVPHVLVLFDTSPEISIELGKPYAVRDRPDFATEYVRQFLAHEWRCACGRKAPSEVPIEVAVLTQDESPVVDDRGHDQSLATERAWCHAGLCQGAD
jgi:hypothetical protein